MANELPVWNNAWLPRKYPAGESPIYDDIWNPEIDGKKVFVKKPRGLAPETMVDALAASDLAEKDDEEPEDDDTTMANVLSQKQLNEPIEDVIARVNAMKNSKAIQFAQGVPLSHFYGGIQELPTGGYLNPHLDIDKIWEGHPDAKKFQEQYRPTPAQWAGTAYGVGTQAFGPVGTILNAPRTIADIYYSSQMDADRNRLEATAGDYPVSVGANARSLASLGVPDPYGIDQLTQGVPSPADAQRIPVTATANRRGPTSAQMLRINELHQAEADARREEQSINEAIENAETYGGHPADYY
jgi:hypothetical protein